MKKISKKLEKDRTKRQEDDKVKPEGYKSVKFIFSFIGMVLKKVVVKT